MTEPVGMDELRARLSRVEQDSKAALFLSRGADRRTAELRSELREFRAETRAEFADVRAELRGFRDQDNRVLSAIRADVSDLRTDLTDLREHVDCGFAQANDNFLALRGAMDGVAALLQVIADRPAGGKGDDQPRQ